MFGSSVWITSFENKNIRLKKKKYSKLLFYYNFFFGRGLGLGDYGLQGSLVFAFGVTFGK